MKILMINHFPLAGSGSGTYTKNLAVRPQNALPFNFPCFTSHPRSTATFESLSPGALQAV